MTSRRRPSLTVPTFTITDALAYWAYARYSSQPVHRETGRERVVCRRTTTPDLARKR